MQSGVKIGRVGGIDLEVHPSWIIAFGLVSWSLAESYLPSVYTRWTFSQYWLTGVAGALCLFLSVLIHELSHSFVAKARGFSVHSIVLFIFGGVSNIRGESRGPRDEFLISVVGPLMSFGIAGLCWLCRTIAVDRIAPQGIAALDYLVLANVLLGAFNLIPGFPLDGGRVLRSIVWAITGNGFTALRFAGASGQFIGFLFIAFGMWQVFGGNALSGIWIAFIGWFLTNAAEGSVAQSAFQQRLERLKVSDLMEREPPIVEPDISVARLVYEGMLVYETRAFPVVRDGNLLGLVTLSDARATSRDRWASLAVREIMTPRARLCTVGEDDTMARAFELVASGDFNQLPVLSARGELVGLLTRSHVFESLKLRDELGVALGPQRASGTAHSFRVLR